MPSKTKLEYNYLILEIGNNQAGLRCIEKKLPRWPRKHRDLSTRLHWTDTCSTFTITSLLYWKQPTRQWDNSADKVPVVSLTSWVPALNPQGVKREPISTSFQETSTFPGGTYANTHIHKISVKKKFLKINC